MERRSLPEGSGLPEGWQDPAALDDLDQRAGAPSGWRPYGLEVHTIKDIGGSKYMFFEWKSGDYVIAHRKPFYYVLKKADTN